MVVNLANAYRLTGNKAKASSILDNEDWSSSDDSFHISVAAVKEDVNEVIKLMHKIGRMREKDIDYREWPVFRGLQKNKEFVGAYEAIFGEPFLQPHHDSGFKAEVHSDITRH